MRNRTAALLAGSAVVAATFTSPAAVAATPPYAKVWYSGNYQGCTATLTKNYPDLRSVHLTGSGLCSSYTADNTIISAKFYYLYLNCHVTFYTGYKYTGHSQNLIAGAPSDPSVTYPNDYSSFKLVCSS